MANNTYLIEERSRDIGNFMVGRLLPFRRKRQVGPFTFIDHMGPTVIGPDKYFDVDQHPHIGLCTLTYLLQGEIEHRDSTGAVQIIRPGDVGLMTAGAAVAHTERTSQSLRDGRSFEMHGYQVWIALPVDKEEMEPRFDFIAANELPAWTCDGMKMTLLAGEGFGKQSSLPVHSELFMVEIQALKDTKLRVAGELKGELAIVVTVGRVKTSAGIVDSGQMLISMTENHCEVELEEGTRLLLFGGPAFPEERFLHWNFVSHSKDRLRQAVVDWNNKRFPKVPEDNTYIPSPKIKGF